MHNVYWTLTGQDSRSHEQLPDHLMRINVVDGKVIHEVHIPALGWVPAEKLNFNSAADFKDRTWNLNEEALQNKVDDLEKKVARLEMDKAYEERMKDLGRR